jgi:hypothetical protein
MEIFKNDMSFPSKFISEKLKSRLDALPRWMDPISKKDKQIP